MELLIIWLVFGLVFGAICGSMAKSRGRSEGVGFLVGFFLGIWGILVYAIAGKTDKKKTEEINEVIEAREKASKK